MDKLNLKRMIESVVEDISNNSSISSFIFKVQIICRELQNVQFTQWINNEIDGYSANATLPAYRIFNTQVKANLISGFMKYTNHTMPTAYLPKDIASEITKIYLRQSLITLEGIINSSDEKEISFTTSEFEKEQLRKIYEDCTIYKAYKVFNKTDIHFVIHKFKSTLLEMFCNFNDQLFNEEINFDIMTKKNEVAQIVCQTINTGVYLTDGSSAHISNSMIVGGKENTVSISDRAKKEIENIIDQIETLANEIDEDRSDIADAIISIREELENKIPRPRFLKTAFNSLKYIGTGVVANKITPLVDSAVEIIKNLINSQTN